jgi:tetratricopeptide (TPR) repeat protein
MSCSNMERTEEIAMNLEDTAVEELLNYLQNDQPEIRELATAELWRRWFLQMGVAGYMQLQLSQSLLDDGLVEKAEAVLTDLLTDLPNFAEAWNRRAILYYSQGNYQKSLQDCEQVVKLVPYHFGAWHGMGLCYTALGSYRAAIRAFRKALEIQPYALANQRLILECSAML